MAPKVNVWVKGVWYGPSYPDAGDPPTSDGGSKSEPAKADDQPTEPATKPAKAESEIAPPPKTGAGSSRAKWVAYATSHGVHVGDDVTRDDVVDACRAAGVPVD